MVLLEPLLSLLTGHIVDKAIERLKFLPSVYPSKLSFHGRTHIHSREGGDVPGHRVVQQMAILFVCSEFKDVRELFCFFFLCFI